MRSSALGVMCTSVVVWVIDGGGSWFINKWLLLSMLVLMHTVVSVVTGFRRIGRISTHKIQSVE
jgi:hypothetical protein